MPGVMVPGNSFRNSGTSSGNEEPGAQADVCWSLVGWEVCPNQPLPCRRTGPSLRIDPRLLLQSRSGSRAAEVSPRSFRNELPRDHQTGARPAAMNSQDGSRR